VIPFLSGCATYKQVAQLQSSANLMIQQNNQILTALKTLTAQGATIMTDLTELTSDVATETNVMVSAETLITGLAAQIAAAGTDPVALKALTTTMEKNASDLAAAVAANTPAALVAGAGAPATAQPTS
jgi:hypothetical protein